ncbi:PAS domain-containing protein [Pedobacter nyackensis]|uniref:histidine kinase n=1 Tax=Pedobacter nyackensis TaxID=475255 RepID=A0A1W2ANI1_9SPHI|nr:PAS domain S-box protein [Pedobacter nyackensis]SMC62223.1 PAS domain S-box-containing protein [Pedobacter nyackensis]
MLTLENVTTVFRSSPNGYMVLLPNRPYFTIAAVNKPFLDVLKANRVDLVGKGIFETIYDRPAIWGPKGMKSLKNALEHTMQSKKASNYNVADWEINTFPLLDDEEKIKFIVHNLTDTTNYDQQTALNNTLLIQNSFQHPLFNDYPDAVFTLDPEGNFLSANKALIDLTECREEELFKLSFTPFIAPGDVEKAHDHFKKTIQGELQNFDIRIISAKGMHRMLNVTNLPIVINQEVIGVHVIAKDITAITKTQKQLDDYHYRISDILESITDAFIALDRDLIVTYWNKEAERLLLMSREHMIGKNIWEVYQDTIPTKFYSEYRRAVDENISVRFDEYFSRLKIWVEVSVFPSEEGLSLYFKDITKRKHGEEQLQQEKEKYLELFNLSPLPQWVFDAETLQFLDVNNAAVKHYGYSKEEFLEMTIKDIRPAADVKRLGKILKMTFNTGIFQARMVRHLKKSGELMHICVEANAVTFEGKAAMLVLAIDYTEKLKSERALAASEQRFKALVQDGSDLVAILDPTGNYKYVSPTSKSILGIDPELLIGKNVFDFIHKDDKGKVISDFGLLTEQKRIKIMPFRFKGFNGQYHWIETIITDMTEDPVVAGIVANSRDVTLRMEEELKTQNGIDRLREIAWMQSHEVRAPLACVMGLSKILLDNKEDESSRKESLQHLMRSAGELDSIIREIIKKAEDLPTGL